MLLSLIDEIVESDEEIISGVEVGPIIIVEASDGLWYTSSDVRVDYSELTYRRATARITEMWDEATMSEADKIDRAIEVEKKAIAYAMSEMAEHNSHLDTVQMADYTGSQEKYVRDYFEHSFEPKFGSDFNI